MNHALLAGFLACNVERVTLHLYRAGRALHRLLRLAKEYETHLPARSTCTCIYSTPHGPQGPVGPPLPPLTPELEL